MSRTCSMKSSTSASLVRSSGSSDSLRHQSKHPIVVRLEEHFVSTLPKGSKYKPLSTRPSPRGEAHALGLPTTTLTGLSAPSPR